MRRLVIRFRKINWMKFLRRLHLYTGIFLFPWVLLYGVTAFLFNHPFAFSKTAVVTIEGDHFAGTDLAGPTDELEDAQAVVRALNERLSGSEVDTVPLQLNPTMPPRYLKDTLSLRARGAGVSHKVIYDLMANKAIVEIDQGHQEEPAPFEARRLQVANSLRERLRTSLPAALQKIGIEVDEIGMAIGSVLRFQIDSGDQQWIANYQIQTGTVTGTPLDSPRELGLRQVLLNLHRTHSYLSSETARWMWALAVDAMAIAMTLWALSGLLMWWQLKRLRLVGMMFLTSGIFSFGIAVSLLVYAFV